MASGDSDFTIWWGTPLECQSALSRRFRGGDLAPSELRHALELLQEFVVRAYVVQPADVIRERAGRLLAVHALRAGDALQLAAALVWCEEKPRGSSLLSLDDRLSRAATEEGFTVLPEETYSRR